MDTLEFQIKETLTMSTKRMLRWSELFRATYQKQPDRYSENVFKIILVRKIKKLVNSGDLEQNKIGRKQVFYLIPKSHRPKVLNELNRERAHQTFDKLWDNLTPEQQKTQVKDLRSVLIETMKSLEHQHEILSGISERAQQAMIDDKGNVVFVPLKNPQSSGIE